MVTVNITTCIYSFKKNLNQSKVTVESQPYLAHDNTKQRFHMFKILMQKMTQICGNLATLVQHLGTNWNNITGMSDLRSKWVRLSPNGRNP